MKEEFCIMSGGIFFDWENGVSIPYYNRRIDGTARHEIFFGADRKKSIKYGIVVFLLPELHNMSDIGVHFNKPFDDHLKREGQKAAMQYYGWTVDKFREVFGKNYL